jgi:hypothetical protein
MGERPGEITTGPTNAATPGQIKQAIDLERAELGRNLERLQDKVKTTIDWREQFRRNTMTMLGIAFGGGLLLSALFGGRHGSRQATRC